MIKRFFKAVGRMFVGIWDFFMPLPSPSVVHTNFCVHCRYEYPEEYLAKKTFKKEYDNGKYSVYYLYLCPACVLINPRFHHAEITRGSSVCCFWEDDEGNIYEFYEFKENGNGFSRSE